MKLAITVVLVLTGCVIDEEQAEDLSTESSDLLSSNRIALNGITLNRSEMVAAAAGSLASAPTRVPSLFSTSEGRERFAYMVSCSLKSDKTITATVAGVTYTYAGSVGLADDWATKALPPKTYGWVSACMLARTNYFGISVAISLRGPGISTAGSEKDAFTVLEGAFWGDLFSPNGKLYACPSPLKLSGSTTSTLPLRECTVSLDGATTKCGFIYGGDCSTICGRDAASGGYKDCKAGGIKGAAVASVFLANP
ncbi:MAG: hypothetical protein AB7T06_09095 [Kofleriaceae bacterium]